MLLLLIAIIKRITFMDIFVMEEEILLYYRNFDVGTMLSNLNLYN